MRMHCLFHHLSPQNFRQQLIPLRLEKSISAHCLLPLCLFHHFTPSVHWPPQRFSLNKPHQSAWRNARLHFGHQQASKSPKVRTGKLENDSLMDDTTCFRSRNVRVWKQVKCRRKAVGVIAATNWTKKVAVQPSEWPQYWLSVSGTELAEGKNTVPNFCICN